MKKLMLAAVAAAVAGGAFAAPIVYDYKASAKYLYLKSVNAKNADKQTVKVYQKFQKAASLKGYLIMDEDGVTSATVSGGLCVTPSDGTYSLDYGRNRGFLVVMNSNVESAVKAPKILPSILDAKWLDTNFSGKAKTGLAEGTLFSGGDTIAALRPHLEIPAGAHVEIPTTGAPAAGIAGYAAYSDYVWTSVYLFGQYNGPNWYTVQGGGIFAFADWEKAWDANLPTTLRRGYTDDLDPDTGLPEYQPQNAYHDTWLNGAGVGKWKTTADIDEGDLCCGLTPTHTPGEKILDSLAGNLKGGVYICTENGILVAGAFYQWFDGIAWEDQFVCCREENGATTYQNGWQNDLWQDGAMEQETTDVVFGSWSIKLNATFGSKLAKELTEDEEELIQPAAGTDGLWAYLKGAAIALKKNVNFYDGSEIYAATAKNRFKIPVITPQFAMYYGLIEAQQP